MKYTTDIAPLEAEGLTDAEIVSQLQATGLTVQKIVRADLLHLLNLRGMLQKLISNASDEKWAGTVLVMQDAINAVGTTEQQAALRLWLSHITNPTVQFWDTTDVQFSAAFWAMRQAFAGQSGMPTLADFDAVAALGGGWKYASLDESQIAALRAAYQDQQRQQAIESLKAEIENTWINPALSNGSSTATDVRAAIKAGL